MPILAQHGYGKSNKIDDAIERNIISGVILSPQYEKPSNLKKYVSSLSRKFPKISIVLDPQFYVAALQEPKNEGRLSEYPYYPSQLNRRTLRSTAKINDYARKTIDYQVKMRLTNMLSPTILFNSINESSFEFALQLAEASIEYHSSLTKPPRLYASIVMSEDILKSRNSTDELLDEITLLDVSGFYVLIDHASSSYHPQFNYEILTNILYLTYSLSVLNDFRVVFGYSSFVSLLLHAVGVTNTACGWFGTTKQFSINRFRPSSGGRPARPRYSSIPLLNSILVTPELSTCNHFGLLDKVLTGTSFDAVLRANTSSDSWPMSTSILHHWEALSNTTRNLLKLSDVASRLDYMLKAIEKARKLYNILKSKGVQFEMRSSDAHLDNWNNAIMDFRKRLSI
jgi:hypothetical protein